MTIRPEHRKTFPSSRIPETLLMLIRLRGGPSAEVNSAFMYAPLADFYELSEDLRQLSAADYYAGEKVSGIAWNSEVDFAVRCLRKDGYLTVATRSGKSWWRLTPNGAERADFWLQRMRDKFAALSSLKVDPNIASSDTGAESVLRRTAKADSA